MAAEFTYPPLKDDAGNDLDPLFRGDPVAIPITIRIGGVDQDGGVGAEFDAGSGTTWRAQLRHKEDGALVAEFTIDQTPGSATLTLRLDETDSALMRDGDVWDLEQLTPTHFTWGKCRYLRVSKDVSRAVTP